MRSLSSPIQIEHLALRSSMGLKRVCHRVQKVLSLPPFDFDHENETEWGEVIFKQVKYTLSRPTGPGTLQKWDKSVPPRCTLGVSLSILSDHPNKNKSQWIYLQLVVPVAQKLAHLLRTTVHYHRTWHFKKGNLTHHKIFTPME